VTVSPGVPDSRSLRRSRWTSPNRPPSASTPARESAYGKIHSLKDGFGFIRPTAGGATIFFYYLEVQNADFNDLKVGDKVHYKMGENQRGPCAIEIELANVGG
jgi:CspA family cold shock protein